VSSAVDLEVVGGTLHLPSGPLRACLQVSRGVVTGITGAPTGTALRTVDATGLHVLPGMVDEHVHFMEPSDPTREDWHHGTAAAAVGGVTTVVEHTHAAPVLRAGDLPAKRAIVAGRAHVDYAFTAHAFPDTLDELPGLVAAGVPLVKAFTCTTHGVPGLDAAHVLALLRAAAAAGVRVLVHCEDETITAADEARLRAELREDAGLLPEWRSSAAELAAAAVVVVLARVTGARVTIAHVSQPAVLDLVATQRAAGAALTVETCPQYLLLDEEDVRREGALRKFTPPARPAPAQDDLWSALQDGRIHVLAADHAPSTRAQKLTGDLFDCPFGLPGVDGAWSRPAIELGLGDRKGSLLPGHDADLVLVDLGARAPLRDEDVVSKAGWTPFAGRDACRPVATYLRGVLVAEGGRLAGTPAAGREASLS
jgi:dihydroorotase-like cyclic amidohydrolase